MTFIPASEHPYFQNLGKKKKSFTNQLTDDIIDIIEKSGGCARRVNTTGTYKEGETLEKGLAYEIKTKGKYIPSGMKPGFEDISAVIPGGLYLAVELKKGKHGQSPDQKQRQAEIEAAGGLYLIARSKQQFEQDYNELHRLTRYILAPSALHKTP